MYLEFGERPEKLRGKYLDVFEGVRSDILYTTKSDENSELGTTYLGRIDITRSDKIKAEERFRISEQGYTIGKY